MDWGDMTLPSPLAVPLPVVPRRSFTAGGACVGDGRLGMVILDWHRAVVASRSSAGLVAAECGRPERILRLQRSRPPSRLLPENAVGRHSNFTLSLALSLSLFPPGLREYFACRGAVPLAGYSQRMQPERILLLQGRRLPSLYTLGLRGYFACRGGASLACYGYERHRHSESPFPLALILSLFPPGLREYFACRGGAPLAYYSLGIQRHLIFPTTSAMSTGPTGGFVFSDLASGSATGSGSGAGSGTWGLASLVSLGTEDGKSQEEAGGGRGTGRAGAIGGLAGGGAGGGMAVSADRGSAGLGGAVAAAVVAAVAAAVAAGGKGEVGGDGRRTPRLDRALSNFLDMEDPDEFYECPTNAPSETSSDVSDNHASKGKVVRWGGGGRWEENPQDPDEFYECRTNAPSETSSDVSDTHGRLRWGGGEVGGWGGEGEWEVFPDMEDPDEFYECRTNAPSETSSDGVLQRDLSGVMVDGVDASKLPDDWSHVPRDLTPDSLSLPLFIDWSKLSGSVAPNHSGKGKNCWSRPDCNVYKLRSRNYLNDGSMAPAGEPLCQLVAVDWLRPEKHPAAHVAAHKKCLVQRVRACYGDQAPFFILINLQGSWLVKQAVGSHNVVMGQVMETAYHSTEEYFEVDVNMASSSVVRGIMGMVFGYITNLVVDMTFYLKIVRSLRPLLNSWIDWKALHAAGFKAVVFDKDNTLTLPYKMQVEDGLVASLDVCRKTFGSRGIAILSNSAGLKQYDPDGSLAAAMERDLGMPVILHSEKKPGGGAAELETHFGCREDEMVMVGDRCLTDIVFGNRNGLLTVLTAPLSPGEDPLAVRQARRFEEVLATTLQRRGVQAPPQAKFSSSYAFVLPPACW
ncbi:unnamed protein product [Closterium sp. Naga37s-1]|nr:unnamed protein product [Closterium sp. Naga37s-1]